ncbi:MAG TPA: acyl carrier protein [Bacteroidetes bacterium]|nr:acyl carrier protein [Bacteroidota bacterium]
MESIEKKIFQILEDATKGAFSALAMTGDEQIRNDLGISSLQFILLAFKLEEQFGVQVVDADNISDIVTVKNLCDAVKSHL